jgi:hypothetical protein
MKWCDYSCEEAAFPDEALEGACRTVAAVWCRKLKKLIPKNSPCQATEKAARGAPRRGAAAPRRGAK